VSEGFCGEDAGGEEEGYGARRAEVRRKGQQREKR